MRRALIASMVLLSAAGFAVSLFVHLSTYTDMQLVRDAGWLSWMHVLFIPPFVTLIYVLQQDGKIKRARFIPDGPEQKTAIVANKTNGQGAESKELVPNYKLKGRFETSTIFPYGLPQWAVILIKVLAVNLLVQVIYFAFFFTRVPVAGNSAEHGYRVKDKEGWHQVSEEEYFSLKNRELRGYSGIWLIVYLVPALALTSFAAGKKREAEGEGAGSQTGIPEDFRG